MRRLGGERSLSLENSLEQATDLLAERATLFVDPAPRGMDTKNVCFEGEVNVNRKYSE